MNISIILKNLKSISDASAQDFLDLSSSFPILVGELNHIKKKMGKLKITKTSFALKNKR